MGYESQGSTSEEQLLAQQVQSVGLRAITNGRKREEFIVWAFSLSLSGQLLLHGALTLHFSGLCHLIPLGKQFLCLWVPPKSLSSSESRDGRGSQASGILS